MEISGFEVIKQIGEGGMATVWKARQISLDRIVAIKILSSHLSSDPEDVKMFQTEAQSAAKLKHSGIIQVYDANAENGMYYFVMEFIAGYTVGEWVRRSVKLDEADVLLVAECVANALEYAWDKEGMIHCDIKPDNVMIDEDGSVKLADLGLAKTIFAMGNEESEEVMGTPAYISPEQSMGEANLDFRSDIYSLGAMLYHLITGTLMFQGTPEEKVMEMQVASNVPDALDLNGEASQPLCWLIEKMLAKDKADRHRSWAEVKDDIAKVKKGNMPAGMAGDDFSSTMLRSTNRTRKQVISASMLERKISSKPTYRAQSNNTIFWIVGGVVAAICLIVAVLVMSSLKKPTRQIIPRNVPGGRTVTTTTRPSSGVNTQKQKEDAAREMYQYAVNWVKAHPRDHEAALRQLRKVVNETSGTKYSIMAETMYDELVSERKAAIDAVLKKLDDETAYFIKSGEHDYAVSLYKEYSGKMAKETKADRLMKVSELMILKRDTAEQALLAVKEAEVKYEESVKSICDLLVKGETLPALQVVRTTIADSSLYKQKNEFKAIETLLKNALGVDAVILASFKKQYRKTITVHMNGGSKKIVVGAVSGGKVTASHILNDRGAKAPITFGIDDLSVREKLNRMGSENDPAVALVRGQMAVKSKAFDYAKKYFAKTGPVLSSRLLELLGEDGASATEKKAESMLRNGLKRIGVRVAGYDEAAWLDALSKKQFNKFDVPKAKQLVADFNAASGKTKFAESAQQILDALLNAEVHVVKRNIPDEPEPEPEIPEERAVSGPQEDPQVVLARLVRANTGLDADAIRFAYDDDGNVISARIRSYSLKDLKPLAGLTHLRKLYIGSGSRSKPAPVRDLSPLKDLPIDTLTLACTSVKDIAPLSKMPLTSLVIQSANVGDITPLKNLRLTHLEISNAPLRDIKVLRGMPLRSIVLSGIKSPDFRALARMRLKSADFSHTMFKDVASLDMRSLVSLNIADTKTARITNLKNCTKLKHLNISDTMVRDISHLRGLSLRSLNISHTKVTDVTAIMETDLERFSLRGISLKDYAFLADMPLVNLDIAETKVRDLTMLRGLDDLKILNVSGTNIKTLDHIAGLSSLVNLSVSDTKITGLGVLAGLEIEQLSCQKIPCDMLGITGHKTIRFINVDIPVKGANRGVLRSMRKLKRLNGSTFDPLEIP